MDAGGDDAPRQRDLRPTPSPDGGLGQRPTSRWGEAAAVTWGVLPAVCEIRPALRGRWPAGAGPWPGCVARVTDGRSADRLTDVSRSSTDDNARVTGRGHAGRPCGHGSGATGPHVCAFFPGVEDRAYRPPAAGVLPEAVDGGPAGSTRPPRTPASPTGSRGLGVGEGGVLSSIPLIPVPLCVRDRRAPYFEPISVRCAVHTVRAWRVRSSSPL